MRPAPSPSLSLPTLCAAAAIALAFAGGLSLAPHRLSAPTPVLVHALACAPPAKPFARLELVFGSAKPDGGTVTHAEWAAFLDAEITPRFPAGLTVLTGTGQWRDADGRIARETARVLLIWHVPTAATEPDIAAIRDAYRRRFRQQSVLRADSVACVGF